MNISIRIFAGIIAILLTGFIAISSASATTTFFICKRTSNGNITVRNKCRSNESKISNFSTLQGSQGPAGSSGLSEAFSGSRVGSVSLGSDAYTLVGRLQLPTAGKYIINAKLSLEQTTTSLATTAICQLAVDGTFDQVVTKLGNSAVSGVPHRDAIALQLVYTTTGATSATVSCIVGSGTTGTASNTRITAVQVNNITDGSLGTS